MIQPLSLKPNFSGKVTAYEETLGSKSFEVLIAKYGLGLRNSKVSAEPLIHVSLFATLWTTARQASLSITNFWSLLKLVPIALVK